MKKIFTIILFATGTIGFAAAQNNNQNNFAYNSTKQTGNYYDQHAAFDNGGSNAYHDDYFTMKAKEAKLKNINREFDQKIAAVKNNRWMNSREKGKQIQWLQAQRKDAIRQVEFQYEKNSYRDNGKKFDHNRH